MNLRERDFMASLQMPKALISTTASLRPCETRRIKARRSRKIKASVVRPGLRNVAKRGHETRCSDADRLGSSDYEPAAYQRGPAGPVGRNGFSAPRHGS